MKMVRIYQQNKENKYFGLITLFIVLSIHFKHLVGS